MTGIRVGQSTWTVRIDPDRYSASASGGSVDLMNVLVRGEGSARVSGNIRDGRVAEGTALLRRHTGNRIEGSNPSLSAKLLMMRP